MEKTDIVQVNLSIQKLSNVLQNQLNIPPRPFTVNGRLNDAFVYILSGSCRYVFDDGDSFTVNTGDMLYLADGAVYTMHIQEEPYAHIFCDFLFDCPTPRRSAVFTPVNREECEKLFRRLYRTHRHHTKEWWNECMALLYRIYGMAHEARRQDKSSRNDKIERIREYIDGHCTDYELSVSMLARECEMSEVHFRKLFKEATGVSPSGYITAARLKHATDLMRYPFLTLEDCAVQSGFSSLAYFCRVFKNAMGITPAQYRRETMNQQ